MTQIVGSIGRHRRCGTTMRLDIGVSDEIDMAALGDRVILRANAQTWQRDGHTYVSRYDVRVACTGCGMPLLLDLFQPIKGVYAEDVPCNAKCTGAIGPSCSCSCGGRNHGGRYNLRGS
jgi:hypothetical protein